MSTQQVLAANPFFEGCARGQFLLQKCGAHGHLQYPPGPLCRQCGARMNQWVEASGEGTVQAFSLVQRAPMPAFDAYLPYMVAVVQLREGPLVETWLKRDGRTPMVDELAIGQSVRFGFESINGLVVPVALLQ
ncbi:MAG: OB-fold domain-containing protein [Betaproteobacteria bacterium]|jgi:hypothetical protein